MNGTVDLDELDIFLRGHVSVTKNIYGRYAVSIGVPDDPDGDDEDATWSLCFGVFSDEKEARTKAKRWRGVMSDLIDAYKGKLAEQRENMRLRNPFAPDPFPEFDD